MSVSKVKTVKVSVEIPEENAKLLATLIASWNGKVCVANSTSEEPKVQVETKETLVSKEQEKLTKCESAYKFFDENFKRFSLKDCKKKASVNALLATKSEGWSYKKSAYAIVSDEKFKSLFSKSYDFEELAKLDEITQNENAYKMIVDFVKFNKKSLWFKSEGFTGLLLNGYVVSLKSTTYKTPSAKNPKKSTTIRFNAVETLKLF